eukprot:c23727_g1_i1 orf=443-2287(-)
MRRREFTELAGAQRRRNEKNCSATMTRPSPSPSYVANESLSSIHDIPTHSEHVHASEAFNKKILVAAHMAHLHDAYILEMGTHPVNLEPPTPTSPSKPLEGLKSIGLKELKVGKVHRRHVLIGSLCVPSVNMHGVVNILEDEHGNAVNIWIRNAVPDNCSTAQVQRLYPQASRVAIREPYLTRLPDDVLGVLIEHTTDLVFLWLPKFQGPHSAVYENMGTNAAEAEEVQERGLKTLQAQSNQLQSTQGSDINTLCCAIQLNELTRNLDNSRLRASVLNGEALEKKKGEANCEHNEETYTKQHIERQIKGNAFERLEETDDCTVAVDKEGREEKEKENYEDKRGQTDKAYNVAEPTDDITAEPADDITAEGWKEIGVEVGPVEPLAYASEVKTDASNGQVSATIIEENIVDAHQPFMEGNGTKKLYPRGEKNGAKEEPNGQSLRDSYCNISTGDLRLQGNQFFAKGDWAMAAQMYSLSIEKSKSEQDSQKVEVEDSAEHGDSEAVLSLSNRAEVWLRLGKYEQALEDSDRALKEQPGHLKSLFRKGRSLMGLQRYEEALPLLRAVQERAFPERELQASLIECRSYLEVKRAMRPGKKKRVATARKRHEQKQQSVG